MTRIFKKLVFSLILLVFPACCNPTQRIEKSEQIIHKAHLSDGWYPQNKDILDQELTNYFKLAHQDFDVTVDPNSIKALIVPHAGIYFSGLCAATAYQTLLTNKENFEKNKKIKRVIILSPSHTKAFTGISLPDYNAYETVLGTIKVDAKTVEILKENNLFKNEPETHDREHAIEVQLPFLQKTIESFEIVPLIVGHIDNNQYNEICNTLKKIIDDKTLIIISSDFTHYGSNYGYAPFSDNIFRAIRFVDSLAINAITANDPLTLVDKFNESLNKTQATICGQNSIKILLKLLEQNVLGNLNSKLSCYYTSPQMSLARSKNDIEELTKDVTDDLAQTSVSYAGIVFTSQKLDELKKEEQLTEYEKKSLLKLAQDTIENNLSKEKTAEHLLWPVISSGLKKEAGAFVTLNTKDGQLRGCIGRIVSDLPLFQTVQIMAKTAAFNDTRFSPVTQNELDDIVIDITVLTPPKKIDSYKDIELGKHGIILKKLTKDKGSVSSVFLPQVPPSFGWNLQTTLEQLALKAGLGKNDWQQDCKFEVFEGFEIYH